MADVEIYVEADCPACGDYTNLVSRLEDGGLLGAILIIKCKNPKCGWTRSWEVNGLMEKDELD